MSNVVPYTHYNFFLANSYQSVDDIMGDLVFDFEEYVKSQVHYNITSDLYNRDFLIYVRVLKCIQEDKIDSDVLKVLGYFYKDIASIVLRAINRHKSCDFDFDIIVNLKGMTEYPINIEDVRTNIIDIINLRKPNTYLNPVDGIAFFKYVDKSILNKIQITDVVCKAATLYHFSKNTMSIKWR